MNWQLFSSFLAIVLLLLLAPGPIVMLVISTALAQGRRAALVTVAGTSVGNAALLAVISIALEWVLRHALHVFEVLRWMGALYLVWLGVQAWRSARAATPTPQGGQVYFWRGFAVAASNPKTIVFYAAFLPQFVDPTRAAGYQITVMCVASVLMAAITDSGFALAAGLARNWFGQPARARMLARTSGVVLITAGVWLSLARPAFLRGG